MLTLRASSLVHLSKYILSCIDCSTNNNDNLKALGKKIDKRLSTYLYLMNSDENKHDNVLNNLNK